MSGCIFVTLSSFFNECSTKMFHGWGREIFKIKIFYFFLFGGDECGRAPARKGGALPRPEMPYYYSKQGDDQWLHNGLITLDAVSICFLSQLNASASSKMK